MSPYDRPSDKRAQHVALVGGMLQFVGFAAITGLYFWSGRSALLGTLARFLLVGVPVWLALYLVLNQMRRAQVEALETDELRRAQASGTSQAIFELDDEALLLERNRLKWMVGWLLPAVTVVITLYLLVGHFVGWSWALSGALEKNTLAPTGQPTLMMWFLVAVGFLDFLFARYALAVARLPQWRLIRAGAVFLSGSALACVLVAVALMATNTLAWTEPVGCLALRLALLVLGAELAANFVLDLYRPHVPGEVPRPSFDSRLFGMIGEPGGFAKSLAEAFNYQFGFQVSSTWFYLLLQRWLFPVTVFAAVVVLTLSSVVIVDADEQAVVERFGRPPAESVGALSPGLHFKWPYPIDIVHRASVKRISEVVLGEATQHDEHDGEHPILWTEAHEFVPELMLVVAAPKTDEPSATPNVIDVTAKDETPERETESVAVSLLMVSVPIEYRIKDLKAYLYTYSEPDELLEAVAYRYLTDYAAGVDSDVLMGPGRDGFNRDFRAELQRRVDQLGLGLEIVRAGMGDAHPPAEKGVAQAFQSVVAAQTSMGSLVNAAEGEAQRILTSLAGTATRATALDEAIRQRDSIPSGSTEAVGAGARVAELLRGDPARDVPPISGRASAMLAEAEAEASNQTSLAASKALSFGTQVAAYHAAPQLYLQRKKLEVWGSLGSVRKYLIVGDRSNVIIEHDTAKESGLDQVLKGGVEQERKN